MTHEDKSQRISLNHITLPNQNRGQYITQVLLIPNGQKIKVKMKSHEECRYCASSKLHFA